MPSTPFHTTSKSTTLQWIRSEFCRRGPTPSDCTSPPQRKVGQSFELEISVIRSRSLVLQPISKL